MTTASVNKIVLRERAQIALDKLEAARVQAIAKYVDREIKEASARRRGWWRQVGPIDLDSRTKFAKEVFDEVYGADMARARNLILFTETEGLDDYRLSAEDDAFLRRFG